MDSFYIIIVMNANSDNLCYTLVFLRGLFTDSAAGFLLIPLFTRSFNMTTLTIYKNSMSIIL